LDPGRTEPRSRRRRRLDPPQLQPAAPPEGEEGPGWAPRPPDLRRRRLGGRETTPRRGSTTSRRVGAAPPWIRAVAVGWHRPAVDPRRTGHAAARHRARRSTRRRCSPPSSGICKGASVRGTRSTIDLREKKEGSTPCAGSAAAAGASMPASGPPRRPEEGEEGAPSGPPPPPSGRPDLERMGRKRVGRKRGRLRLSIPIYTCRDFPWRAFNVVRHGKLIYRGGHLTMSATVNRVFTVTSILICPPPR